MSRLEYLGLFLDTEELKIFLLPVKLLMLQFHVRQVTFSCMAMIWSCMPILSLSVFFEAVPYAQHHQDFSMENPAEMEQVPGLPG